MGRGRARRKQASTESGSDSEDSPSPPKNKRSKRSSETTRNDEIQMESTTSRAVCRHAIVTSENPTIGLRVQSPFHRCGKLMSIRLKNFMCHSNLFIEFGPNINFLVGSNGSGKSAVITALALGLAGSARNTSRASSIRMLIKNGETSATIELTLCNTGSRPFNFDTYGPQITVVRHIRQSSSAYELRDAHRRTVSKKLDEIRRMLLFFTIMVENPIFVLNQEASREFLKELEPGSNYRLLMKATQLDLCAASLNSCHEMGQLFNYNLNLIKMKNDKLKQKYHEEEEKLAIIKNEDAIKTQLKEAMTMLAWRKVSQIQDNLSKKEHTLKIVETKNADLSQKTTQKDCTKQTLSDELKKLNEIKSRIMESYQEQDVKLRAVKRTIQECHFTISSTMAGIKNAERRLKEEQTTYEGCQSHMKNYHADYSEFKRLREENAAALATLKQTVSEGKELISKLRDEQNDIKNQLPATKERVESIKNELSKLRKSEQNLQWEMESLLRNKSNKMSVYGEQAMQVSNALSVQYSGSNASNMPRGPIGMYITVPNPKYRDLVENQLFNCLRSYIVSTDKERISLRALLQKSYLGRNIPTIITSAFTNQVYNVSKYKVQSRSSNTAVLMDLISCDDPVVMNYLIDTMRIETVLVTDSKETAEALTSNSENVPPHLTRILVPDLGLEYCPSPNYAMYSVKITSARYIQVNVDDRIRQLQSEQNSLKERGATIQPQYANAKHKLDIVSQEISTKNDMINAQHTANTKALQKIMDIENLEYRELPALVVLETHLTSSSEKIEKCKAEREVLQNQLRDLNERKARTEEEAKSEEKIIDAIKNKARDVETAIKEVQKKLSDLDRHFVENQRLFKQTNDLLTTMLKDKKDLEKELENERQTAQESGDFIATQKSKEAIRDKITRYKVKIRHYESMNLNYDEVQKKLTSLRDSLKTETEKLDSILSIVNKLRISYHAGAQKFIRSRYHFFSMIAFEFKRALACRQFEGEMEPNHKEKTLKISVYPPGANKTSNTKSLSGGERSFTTVSLLKGLWSISDHPFYFLDEYDVFTDEVNRTFITKMLIKEGTDYQNRQYCFLTPQDTKIDASNLITVHKLEAPEH
ncbi:structural maintenance of chromosomes protein 6 [Drosophila grimshawi]|uniref:GH18920 n=1 Tax=Drosophila grimshawi TaxID=7222 RepID=B4JH41_DROGR|nr:structural maintenance of chromosomes protein 6 [Drosophila grimshawi]EDV92732.1 GH18920 [Drosophila grimshawi]